MRMGALAELKGVSNNEQTEFTQFFQESWEPCLRTVTVIVGSPQLAEDQVAEAFAKAWASWRKVSRHPAPRAWVVRAALNTGASWWRRCRGRELPGRSGCTCPAA
jgi:DNA-directed RNA polymerase specialized sigma24 family protein